jgi:hypothetical protein
LLDLTPSEQRQVDLGNALLRTQIIFLYLALVYNFSALMEHPARAHWQPSAPSSWLLPELAHLASLDGVDAVYLDQCTAGAPWRKATTLLGVNLPGLRQEVALLPGAGRCSPALRHVHVSLSGKAEDGSWRTSPAKTYPPGMCRLLARAIHRRAASVLAQHAGVSPEMCPPDDALLSLVIPINWYDPSSWTAHTHDCVGHA